MQLHDCYALALSMLDGDREARKVLADILEEQGERGLAQWAREGRNDKRRRTALAIMLLPWQSVMHLMVDLMEQRHAQRNSSETVRMTARSIRDCVAGKISFDETLLKLSAAREELRVWRWYPGSKGIQRDQEDFAIAMEALRCVKQSMELDDAGCYKQASQLQADAKRQLRQMIRPHDSQLDWIMRRVGECVTELMQTGEPTWPK